MKILYAVQATGNGHISRAHQLYPYLSQIGETDIVLSGNNSTLDMNIPVKYRTRGLSLMYNKCGSINYFKTFMEYSYSRNKKDISDLPVEKYDLIINDFDYITAMACKLKNKKSIQFGHQGSFMSPLTPRPKNKSIIGEWILKNYAPADHYVGLHFKPYDNFIFNAVIKDKIIAATPRDNGHITVYLPSYENHCLVDIFKSIKPIEVHWFLKDVISPYKEDNIIYYNIDHELFNESLIHCHGLLTGGGFETPAEALYLGKKLMTIPIIGQYEQQCNSAALEEMGIPKLNILNHKTKATFYNWLISKTQNLRVEANNINETLEYIANLC
jgi:uncharacterized protein (TIGR00661 family)